MFTLNIEAVSFKDLSSPYLEKQPKFKSFSIGKKQSVWYLPIKRHL